MQAVACAILAAVVVGSLVEYWGHRLMHAGLMRETHIGHHQDGTGQGCWPEFVGYLRGSAVILPTGFLHSMRAGLGFAVGSILYAACAAYAHQLQHERPADCFWLRRPVHFLHHSEGMWAHNFGITTPLWDWVFGTLRAVDYVRPPRGPWRDLLDVDWGWPSAPRASHPERVSGDRRDLVRHVEEHDRGSHDSTVERHNAGEHQVEPDQ
jgi:sterol desaturase/sphingolipid hydroxylase (fatty acid hydroxylase superfamily)